MRWRNLGAELADVARGRVAIALPIDVRLSQQDGFLRAGVVVAALDSACGYAALALMPEEAEVLTVELNQHQRSETTLAWASVREYPPKSAPGPRRSLELSAQQRTARAPASRRRNTCSTRRGAVCCASVVSTTRDFERRENSLQRAPFEVKALLRTRPDAAMALAPFRHEVA